MRRLASTFLLCSTLATASAGHASVVLDWNETLLDAIRTDKTPPPRASRAMAMVHVAVFDAVNGIVGGYEPYHVTANPPLGASVEAAVAAAAHRVLIELYPAQEATLDAALAASLEEIPDGVAETSGRVWGENVAEAILELRADDHSSDVVSPLFATGGGWWAPTPPSFGGALLPQWPQVTPWALSSASELRSPAPPLPSSPQHAAAFTEVKRLGRASSTFRTADQTQIALFWNDGAGTATPPGHWNEIAQPLLASQPLIVQARTFALLGIAMADAAIVAWDHKYAYNCWRPVTGIQQADQDGNPATVADPAWTSLIGTPPFPAYTSGHSTFSAASARLLALVLGSDAVSFSATSDGLPGVTRQYSSLWQAAEEAGQSRIYGGIHWQYDNQAGLTSGRALAEQVFHTQLQPIGVAHQTCTSSDTDVCLNGDRFRVTAHWRTADASGTGHALPLDGDSGSFWFFDDGNAELLVKVLDGCALNEKYWVFASGLTNVEVTLDVTDTDTGRTRRYFRPSGDAFQPIQDVDAFDCH
jgi:membrane-associated phospholipid phosphatase